MTRRGEIRMKRTSKWLISCSIIFAIGLIITAALTGYVFFNELQSGESSTETPLQLAGVKSFSITSDIPVNIEFTAGKPRVQIEQKIEYFLGKTPEYKCDIKNEGNILKVEIEQKEWAEPWLGIGNWGALATVYLPEMALEEMALVISENNGLNYNNRIKTSNTSYPIDLSHLDIKDLYFEGSYTGILLDGAYENVTIENNRGRVKMYSTIPSKVTLKDCTDAKLMGQYHQIEGTVLTNLSVNTETIANIKLDNIKSQLNLKGSYNEVEVVESYALIEIDSTTPYTVNIASREEAISLKGPIKKATIASPLSEITIQETSLKGRFEILDSPKSVRLVLPSNFPGLRVESMIDGTIEDLIEYKRIQSDFTLQQIKDQKDTVVYQYGDGSTKFYIKLDEETMMRIEDGGYSSKVEQ